MSDDRPRSLAEMSVLLPLGVAGTIADALPDAARRARHELVLARFIGKLTVDQAVREIRRRMETSEPAPNGATSVVRAPAGGGTPLDDSMPVASSRDDGPADALTVDEPVSAPAVESLALPDYDQLPAAHIVAKLSGLTSDERAGIEAYERSHRARRTVLNKLTQLR